MKEDNLDIRTSELGMMIPALSSLSSAPFVVEEPVSEFGPVPMEFHNQAADVATLVYPLSNEGEFHLVGQGDAVETTNFDNYMELVGCATLLCPLSNQGDADAFVHFFGPDAVENVEEDKGKGRKTLQESAKSVPNTTNPNNSNCG